MFFSSLGMLGLARPTVGELYHISRTVTNSAEKKLLKIQSGEQLALG